MHEFAPQNRARCDVAGRHGELKLNMDNETRSWDVGFECVDQLHEPTNA